MCDNIICNITNKVLNKVTKQNWKSYESSPWLPGADRDVELLAVANKTIDKDRLIADIAKHEADS